MLEGSASKSDWAAIRRCSLMMTVECGYLEGDEDDDADGQDVYVDVQGFDQRE